MQQEEKIKVLEEFLRRVDKIDPGIYPKSVQTGDPNKDYRQRTDFMEGRNEGVKEVVLQIARIMDNLYLDINEETGEIIYNAPKD